MLGILASIAGIHLIKHAPKAHRAIAHGVGHAFRVHQAAQQGWMHAGRAAKHTQAYMTTKAATGGIKFPKS